MPTDVTRLPGRRSALPAVLGLLLPVLVACGGGSVDVGTPGAEPDTEVSPSAPVAGQSPAARAAEAGGDPPSAGDRTAIDAMLDVRARAVLDGDEARFLATVDDRDPGLVEGQRVLFANLSRLPLASFSYQTSTDSLLPDPVRGDDPTLRLQTVERLRIAPTFTGPVGNVVRMTYVERDGTWLLGAETAPEEVSDQQSTLRPWFGEPIEVAARGPLVVLGDAADPGLAETLADLTVEAVAADAALLSVPVDQQLMVDATDNGAPVRMNARDAQEAAAVYSAVFDIDVQGRQRGAVGGTVRINPTLTAEQITADPGLLRHEMVHFLLRDEPGRLPTWLAEGIAEYARWYPLTTADLGVKPSLWTRIEEAPRVLADVGTFSLDPDVNYLVAQAAVQHLFSLGGVGRLHVLLDDVRSETTPGRDVTASLLREVYGISEETLLRETWDNLAELDH